MEAAIAFVCEKYPRYGLEHFNLLTFRQGGLTWGQLSRLYQLGKEREVEEFKLQARLHGASFEEDEESTPGRNVTKLPSPAETQDMTQEEREELTREMIGKMAGMGVQVNASGGKVRAP